MIISTRRSPLQVDRTRGLGTRDGGSGLEPSQQLVLVPLRDPVIEADAARDVHQPGVETLQDLRSR